MGDEKAAQVQSFTEALPLPPNSIPIPIPLTLSFPIVSSHMDVSAISTPPTMVPLVVPEGPGVPPPPLPPELPKPPAPTSITDSSNSEGGALTKPSPQALVPLMHPKDPRKAAAKGALLAILNNYTESTSSEGSEKSACSSSSKDKTKESSSPNGAKTNIGALDGSTATSTPSQQSSSAVVAAGVPLVSTNNPVPSPAFLPVASPLAPVAPLMPLPPSIGGPPFGGFGISPEQVMYQNYCSAYMQAFYQSMLQQQMPLNIPCSDRNREALMESLPSTSTQPPLRPPITQTEGHGTLTLSEKEAKAGKQMVATHKAIVSTNSHQGLAKPTVSQNSKVSSASAAKDSSGTTVKSSGSDKRRRTVMKLPRVSMSGYGRNVFDSPSRSRRSAEGAVKRERSSSASTSSPRKSCESSPKRPLAKFARHVNPSPTNKRGRKDASDFPIASSSSSSDSSSDSDAGSKVDSKDKLKSFKRRRSKKNAVSGKTGADASQKSRSDGEVVSQDETPAPGAKKKEKRGDRSDSGSELDLSGVEILESSLSETEDEVDNLPSISTAAYWTQTCHARPYYIRVPGIPSLVEGTDKLAGLQQNFFRRVVKPSRTAKIRPSSHNPPPLTELLHKFGCSHKNCSHGDAACSSSSSSSCDSESESGGEEESSRWTLAQEEMKRKLEHPFRLHKDLWFNEKDQMNDGPLCRCSWKSRAHGIRHNIYPGEQSLITCDPNSNNAQRLYHYRVTITPTINFSVKPSTVISHDGHDFSFEGFSILTHAPIPEKLPPCKLVRYNFEYTIGYLKEEIPENFTVRDLNLFWEYLFFEIFELFDLNLRISDDDSGCNIFHVLPRFSRELDDGGKELLATSYILKYLLDSYVPIVPQETPESILNMNEKKWETLAQSLRGELIHNSGLKPSAIRVDQLDREPMRTNSSIRYPIVVHFGVKPAMLTYAGNPEYQKAWKQYVKFRHLLANKPKVTSEDRAKLALKEATLQTLRAKASLKRDVTVEVSCRGFYRTGIYTDISQFALILPALFQHLRFHWSLGVLQAERLKYQFKSRALLQLSLTHPSYRTHYGINPDHARNTLTNAGMRQPEYGDARIHHAHTRKRGINTLIDIMARMGSKKAKKSPIMNNERLEYLGDAVIEFLTSIHLFFMFPDEQEGGLASYRSALVQNRHLSFLAKRLGLDDFMLYAHGPDLCHEADLKHAMANCFEAIMAALYLDGGLDVVDRIYGECLFPPNDDLRLYKVWTEVPKHPLQELEPDGDRHWIDNAKSLQKLVELEKATGMQFKHVRILAKAFTRRNVGYNFLTLYAMSFQPPVHLPSSFFMTKCTMYCRGHNQRLEFLGDTVLQLITSTYLYKHFPEHHEGHLSLLRSCLVNNKTQSVICDDLGLTEYIVQPSFSHKEKEELRMKDKADLVESLIGAIYVDRGLQHCKVFCKVCFFPRLKYFIVTQKWNDAKSQLQQCCLTLRSPSGGEPDIPIYKVIDSQGPTNTRLYTVAVYFRGKRLSKGQGHSIQQAEMHAAEAALKKCQNLFPHLERQRSIIEKRFQQRPPSYKYPAQRGRPFQHRPFRGRKNFFPKRARGNFRARLPVRRGGTCGNGRERQS